MPKSKRLRLLHFLSLVETADRTACWLWKGRTMPNGYGVFGRELAHRVSYELLFEAIPEGLTLDHLCAVKNCVNPLHMEPVTLAENIRRGPLGQGNWNKRKTRCKRGHPFDESNTYLRSDGGRACKACMTLLATRQRVSCHVDAGARAPDTKV